MAKQLAQDIGDDELMSRSVMDEPRSGFQKLQDLLVGRSPSERMTSGLTSLTPLRVGVKPGMEKMASQLTQRGLRGPWFHGTPSQPSQIGLREGLLREGFQPERIGATTGTRLGEPAGVSLTRDPRVASTFGDVLRVGVDVPPSSVGQFVDPEVQRLFRAAYEKATPDWIRPDTSMLGPSGLKTSPPIGVAQDVGAINQRMTDYLRSQGLEAIQYNPRRWAEHELRVLDPQKAVPLGVIESPGNLSGARSNFLNNPVMRRYYEGSGTSGALGQNPYYGLRTKLDKEFLNAPEFPLRLKDVLLGASD
jgi:hypothetical protein